MEYPRAGDENKAITRDNVRFRFILAEDHQKQCRNRLPYIGILNNKIQKKKRKQLKKFVLVLAFNKDHSYSHILILPNQPNFRVMGSLLFPKHLIAMVLFSLYASSFAQYELERGALYALKQSFKDPFLNDNWKGLQCYENASFWYGIQCTNGRVTAISLASMGLSGKPSANSFVLLSELTTLSFKNNSISGSIMDFSSNQKLKDLDLSKNMFDGSIPRSLVRLNFLESLQLQENRLTGPIPEFNQPGLRVFNVSHNNISGPIPGTPGLKKFGTASYSSNGHNMCDSGTCNFSENETTAAAAAGNHSKKMYSIATLFLVVDIIGLATVILLLILYCKKSRKLKKVLMARYRLEEEKKMGI